MSNPSDILNKARLFDNNLATHPISAAKVIPILVDFASKIEELLDDMRSLFDGLGLEPNHEVALEHVPDLSMETKDISSLTGWGCEPPPTGTPTKPAQLGPSKPTKDNQKEELVYKLEAQPKPLEQGAGVLTTTKEIRINNINMARKMLEYF